MNKKQCTRCGEIKDLKDFYSTGGEYMGRCKLCVRKWHKDKRKTPEGKAAQIRATKVRLEGVGRYGKGRITNLKKRSEKKGLECDLTPAMLKEWWINTPDICYYCGISKDIEIKNKEVIKDYLGNSEIILNYKSSMPHSIIRSKHLQYDRKNSNLGYTFSNIVKCCSYCNLIKSDYLNESIMKKIAPLLLEGFQQALIDEGLVCQ